MYPPPLFIYIYIFFKKKKQKYTFIKKGGGFAMEYPEIMEADASRNSEEADEEDDEPIPLESDPRPVNRPRHSLNILMLWSMPRNAHPITSNRTRTCCICQVNEPDILFSPCHHLAACCECVRTKLSAHKTRTPRTVCFICRMPVTKVTYVYLAGSDWTD